MRVCAEERGADCVCRGPRDGNQLSFSEVCSVSEILTVDDVNSVINNESSALEEEQRGDQGQPGLLGVSAEALFEVKKLLKLH